MTPEQKKAYDLKKRMDRADWTTNPAKTYRKFFGKKGLETHSLSDAQLKQLTEEVQNKSEWQAVSMTTYWDCSSQYCLSFKPGRDNLKQTCPNVNNNIWHKGPRKIDHASERLGLFEGKDGHVYGTVAASSSLGVDDKQSMGCGKCYAIRRGEDANFGGYYHDTELTVMVSNWCPASRDAPCPAPGKIGEFGTKYHFDLAVPGGGMGTMPTCAHTYQKEDGRSIEKLKHAFNNTLHSCSELPFSLQKSCYLYHKKVAQYPLNLGIAAAEVDCPPELTERFECNKKCVGKDSCDDPLNWHQLNTIVKKGGQLTKAEKKAWQANISMSELKIQEGAEGGAFRQKLSLKKK